MRLYGGGPFHRELKLATAIRKKTHFVIREGDIIYNKLFAWKGTLGVVPPAFDQMLVSDKFPTYELDETKCDRNYLRWYFRYPPLWEQARQMSIGSAALSKLTLNPPRFLELTIPLPPPPEQRRIVVIIEELAAKIEEAAACRNSSLDGAKHLFRSVLKALSNLVSSEERLGDVLLGKPRNGWSPHCDNSDGGAAVLSLAAVTGFRYNGAEHKRTSLPSSNDAHYWLRPGDLLITRSNTPDLVGHAAIYDGTPSPCIYSDLMMRIPLDLSKVVLEFVWYWLQTPLVRDFISRNATGTSPTMKKISQGTVMAIPFPVHINTNEQRRIVTYLDDLRAKMDCMKTLQVQTQAELNALLPSILDKAFKGEL
jgi:type I restriction enzyme S subunit